MSDEGETPAQGTAPVASDQRQHAGAQPDASIVLLPDELEALTGCTKPSLQLKELRRQGFWRARLAPGGRRVVLERAHYEAVCQGRDLPLRSAGTGKLNKPSSLSKKVPLAEWAAERWDPPPSQWVLLQWVSKGEIWPPAEKVGNRYYVLPDAQRLTGDAMLDAFNSRPSLVERLKREGL